MLSPFKSKLLPSFVVFWVYLLTAKLGLTLGSVSTFATLVWPPTGIALAAVVLYGNGLWPALFLAAFLINFHIGAPFLSSLGIGIGNTAEAVIGAYLLKRSNFSPRLDRLKDVIGLIFWGAILSTLVSATIGVASLWLTGFLGSDHCLLTWRTWWTGDILGDLVVAPLILIGFTCPKLVFQRLRVFEAVILGSALTVFSLWVFHQSTRDAETNYSVIYAIFPITAWAAVRFGQLGSVSAIFWVSMITIWSTTQGFGPFAGPSLSTNLFFLQTFQATLAASGMILAAAMSERTVSLQQAQSALQARDDFLAIASHELRTPLTLLHLNLQLIEKKHSDLSKPAFESLLSALSSARRLIALHNKLLDLTKIKAGKLTLKPERFDLFELTEAMVSLYSADAKQAGITFALQKPNRQIIGHWDRYGIEQVLTNLISNAIKYGDGKPVRIEMGYTSHDQKRVALHIIDQGFGMNSKMKAKIFERFERFTASESISGLGLGLYIARQIVNEHGGLISVESELGQGTRFTVELPTG